LAFVWTRSELQSSEPAGNPESSSEHLARKKAKVLAFVWTRSELQSSEPAGNPESSSKFAKPQEGESLNKT